jgi:hypothetical protein
MTHLKECLLNKAVNKYLRRIAMSIRKRTIPKLQGRRFTTVLSIALCIALTLNTGCISANQTKQSPMSKNKLTETTLAKKQTAEPTKTKQPNGLDNALKGVGEFAEGTAKFATGAVVVAGVVVGSMFLNYQVWKLSDKMF